MTQYVNNQKVLEKVDVFQSSKKQEMSEVLPEFMTTTANTINPIRIDTTLREMLDDGKIGRVKLIGDSISAGVGCDGYNEPVDGRFIFEWDSVDRRETGTDRVTFPSWANYFRFHCANNYPTVDFFNAGVGGMSAYVAITEGLLDEWIVQGDDAIIIMLGTNDRRITNTVFKDDLQTVVDRAKQYAKIVILMVAPPSMSDYTDDTYATYKTAPDLYFNSEEISIVANEVAEENDLFIIDHYKYFRNYMKDGDIRQLDMFELTGSHPHTFGYQVMWGHISKALGLKEDIRDYLMPKLTSQPIELPATQALADSIASTNFPRGVSYSLIEQADAISEGLPEAKAGVLTTVKFDSLYTIQSYNVVDGNSSVYQRTLDSGAWTAWEGVPTIFDTGFDSIDSSTPYTAFKPNKITYNAINSNKTGFPDNSQGTCITYSFTGNALWVYQLYQKRQSTKMFKRTWNTGAGDWNDWVEITQVPVVSSLPSATEQKQGHWRLVSSAGVEDTLHICIKNAADGYEWKQITLV